MSVLPRGRLIKERASSTEGTGGSSGIVLAMDMVSTSSFAVAYTVPVLVGASQQNLSLQVDTGSSDLWIASTGCSSASCSATGGRLYNPSSSQSTGATFKMQYLSGAVDGPIVWDQVQLGGYTIQNQALAAATTVEDELLSYNYDGILGLALPSDSLIQQVIPASTGDAPDGATFSSNLFSLMPATSAPSQSFFSLTLARPGSTQIPSLLGIGRHPSGIVPDPSQIRYSPLVSGTPFWKTIVRAITVYIDGQAHPIALSSLSGTVEPTALVDSGVPLIITTPALADGIYGALGIGPASDGNYYVPCATPLNMTITLDGQDELALHPLDLTMEPAGQSNAQYCTGLIQTDPSRLTPTSEIGDMVLGVPFLRNVYAVLASGTTPTLGLLGLTNASEAMREFDEVRVLQEPLGSGSGSGSTEASSSGSGGGPGMSVGVQILIGLIGFFGVCLALFALRYVYARRRWREVGLGKVVVEQASGSGSGSDGDAPLYGSSRYTGSTCVADEDGVRTSKSKSKLGEYSEDDECDPWDPYAGTWRDTIVGTEAGEGCSSRSSSCYFPPPPPPPPLPADPESPVEVEVGALLARRDSLGDSEREFGMGFGGMAGIGTAARGSVIDPGMQLGRLSMDSVRSSTPLRLTVSSLRSSHTPSDAS